MFTTLQARAYTSRPVDAFLSAKTAGKCMLVTARMEKDYGSVCF
jgi:hypothetical protein